MANLSTVFLGTPDFAVPTLQALMAAPDFDVIAVYTQPPRQAGRGKRLRPSAVHQAAENNNIPVYTPVSLKGGEVQGEFADLGADVAVVVAYGLILPEPILTAPRLGCFNLHGSLLPRWRGAAPIQRAIMAGDAVTGVCVMLMDKGLDTGPELLRIERKIFPTDTAGVLHEDLAAFVEAYSNAISKELFFLPESPIIYVSALEKIDLGQILICARKLEEIQNRKFATSRINSVIKGLMFRNSPSLVKGKRLKIYYAVQVGKRPIRIRLFCNRAVYLEDNYRKYLENGFISEFQLKGCPIQFEESSKGTN